MNHKFTVVLLALYITAISFGAQESRAATTPNFTSCGNPQGTVKVSYDSGTHGIPGDTNEYKGADTVYEVSPGVYTQCFCPTDGNGIQTNWMKVTSFTESEIEVFKKDGWIFIPNGSVWGLEEKAYLAKNSNYACKTSATPTPTPTPGSSQSTNTGGPSGNVLTTATNVLAPTGNIVYVYLAFFLAVISFVGYLMLRRRFER